MRVFMWVSACRGSGANPGPTIADFVAFWRSLCCARHVVLIVRTPPWSEGGYSKLAAIRSPFANL